MNTIWLSCLAILTYLTTSAGLALRLKNNIVPNPPGKYRGRLLALGFCAAFLHAAALWPSLITPQGMNLNFFNAASLIALLTAVVLLTSSIKQPVESLGIPILPIAAGCIALTVIYPNQAHNLSGGHWKLDLHILFSILAYSVLAIGAIQALLLALQEKHLRNRQPGGFIRALPPMQVMESLLFQMIGTGFSLLSAALLTGIIFIDDILAQHLAHKTILSFIAWGVFAILLWGRWKFGWRGRTAIRWTLTGFTFLLLAYFGSKFVLELILNNV
ncbi:MAG: cytochrome c biogenesis protein CcsA [Gammaproteobacteria bacterium]